MTDKTIDNANTPSGFLEWFYYITIHPFIYAICGLIKYSFYLVYANFVLPLYLCDTLMRALGSAILPVFLLLVFFGLEWMLLDRFWDYALEDFVRNVLNPTPNTYTYWENGVQKTETYSVFWDILGNWIVALVVAGCVNLLDRIGGVIKRNFVIKF